MTAFEIPEHRTEGENVIGDALVSTDKPESPVEVPAVSVAESNKSVQPEKSDSQGSDTDLEHLRRELDLQPRRIILAKVKGYRAWPAMVLDEAHLPENIRVLKPKSIKLSKKSKKPVIIIPVRFFSDDTYIWMKSCDVSPLNGEAIETYLAKKANAKKDTLTDAYKLAQNPPDMVDFIAWGSKGRPPTPDINADHSDDMELDSDSEPQPKKLKLKISIKQKKPTKKPTKTSTLTPATKASKNSTPVPIQLTTSIESNGYFEEDTEGFDTDWGLEEGEFDYTNGDYIFDDEEEQRTFFEQFPRASELASKLSFYQEQFAGFHHEVTPQLMQEEDGDEKKVLAELRKVEKLVAQADTPLIAFRKSPLYRVLLLTVHKPIEVSQSESVRKHIYKIFGNIALDPCVITQEDLREKEPEEIRDGESENENGENSTEVKNEAVENGTEVKNIGAENGSLGPEIGEGQQEQELMENGN